MKKKESESEIKIKNLRGHSTSTTFIKLIQNFTIAKY